MKLHRSGKQADWETVPVARRTFWQYVAAKTHGAITPGNFVSVIGAGLVFGGLIVLCAGEAWQGVVLVTVGRLADVLDGIVAEKTQTKSPVGEAVDATLDKVELFGVLVVFVILDTTPWLVVALIAIQHLANAILSIYAHSKQIHLHPSRAGKLSMAGVWVALSIYALAALLDNHSQLYALGHFFSGLSLIVGSLATSDYARQTLQKTSN